MSLKNKIRLLIALIFVVSFSVIFFYLLIGLKQKQHYEKESSKIHEFFINSVLNSGSDKLIELSKDMSARQELVNFIMKPDSIQAKNNIEVSVSTNYISYSLIFNRDKNLIYSKSGNSDSPTINKSDKIVLDSAFNNKRFCHFYQYLGTELYELAGVTIIPASQYNDSSTVPLGYLINIKHWDSIHLEKLAGATGFKVKLIDILNSRNAIISGNEGVFRYEHQLTDIHGKPVSIIEFTKINDSYREFKFHKQIALIISLVAIVILIIAFILFNRLFFFPVSVLSRALNENNEKPLELLLKSSGDIKKLVEMMLEFFRNKESLQNSNLILNKAIEQSPATIVITNSEGDIEYVNPAFTQISGFTYEEALGKNPRILKSDKTGSEVYTELWQTIKSGKTWSGELMNKRKNGELYFEEAIITPVVASNGTISHFIAIKTDISHRKKMEEIIYASNKRLQLLLALSLIKDVSQELMLDKALEYSIELTNSSIGYIYFYDENSRKFTLHAWSKEVMDECAVIEKKTQYDLESTGIWGEVIRQRIPIIVNDFEKDNPLKKGYPGGHVHLKRFLSVPVFSENEIIAVIGVGNKPEPYDEMDIVQLNLLAESIWAIIRQNEDQKKLVKYASDLKQSNDEFLSQTEELNQLLEMLSSTNDRLSESEEKLKTLINTIPDLIWLKNKDGVYLQANYRFEDFVGAKEHEIIGKTDYNFVDKDLADFFRDNDLKTIYAEKPIMNEVLVTFANDGHQEYLETIKTPVYGTDKSLIGVLGVGRDITKRKNDEIAIKESEERLKEAQEIGNIGHWDYDIAHNKLKWSDQVYKIYEINPDTFNCTFDNVVALFHPDDRQYVIASFYESVEKRITFENTHRIITPGGKLKYVSERAVTKYDEQGKPLSNIGSVIDVTEIKTIEHELKKNEALFHAVFDASPAGISIFNQDGTNLFINKAFESIHGLTMQESIGKHFANRIHPDDIEMVTQKIKELFSGESKVVTSEVRMLHKLEKTIWIRSSASLFPIEFDNKKAIITTNLDITHQKAVERQLIELNATKDKLFSIIGHDLRGPIASFKSMIEMLITEFDLTNTQELTKILELIEASASSSYELLENLLNWAKSQRNEIGFDPTEINLNEIVQSSISILKETANIKGIAIHNLIPEKQKIYGDKNMITTVIRNLISNAIKFTDNNKNIYLSITQKDKYYQINVKDEGIGINANDLPKIFNSVGNYTTFGTAGEKGSGLGLLLCKDFVKRHGGIIWVESHPGIGSEFIFTLPAEGQK